MHSVRKNNEKSDFKKVSSQTTAFCKNQTKMSPITGIVTEGTIQKCSYEVYGEPTTQK